MRTIKLHIFKVLQESFRVDVCRLESIARAVGRPLATALIIIALERVRECEHSVHHISQVGQLLVACSRKLDSILLCVLYVYSASDCVIMRQLYAYQTSHFVHISPRVLSGWRSR